MIKVHCLVSCVCETIKRSAADHRPYYFGVWDSSFSLSADYVLSHHDEKINHQEMLDWYERLYGIPVEEWYDHEQSKDENIAQLIQRIEQKNEDESVIVMLDLASLPERENKFHHDVFPHYVMLEATEDPEIWHMLDPDFRYEGELERERILAAVRHRAVAGGFAFRNTDVRIPDATTVSAYFMSCLNVHHPLTEAVKRVVHHYREQPEGLSKALKQLPVIAIRKYAYEHAFAYLYEAIGRDLQTSDFEEWTDEVETLVNQYSVIQHRAVKYAITRQPEVYLEIERLIEEQWARESAIKRQLVDTFHVYQRQEGIEHETRTLYDQLSASSAFI